MKYLKTYGKQKTKLSAWVAIHDRKQVFDSTSASSSETDATAHQASKPSRKSKRNVNKKKAPSLLTSEDEDSFFTNPLPSSKSTARRKKSSNTQHYHRDEIKCPLVPSDGSSLKSGSTVNKKKSSSKEKTRKDQKHDSIQNDPFVRLPSVGRFVTRRRCANPSHSQLAILNSSAEFAPMRRTSRNNCPSKKKSPSVFLESSADNSENAAVLQSFAIIPLREVFLNESAEHSLGPCSRKPIFCSTPSAAPLNKKLKSFHPISSPASISVSCIGPVNMGSPEHLTSQQNTSPYVVEKHAVLDELQKTSQLHHEKASDSVIFAYSKSIRDKTSPSDSAQSQIDEGNPSSSGLPSQITIDSDLSSCFTSASGEIDWLTDFLKTKCLTQLCTVRLERMEYLIQLFSDTTYSSCLGDLESICSSVEKEHSLSLATSHSEHVKHSERPSSLNLAVTSDVSKSSSVPDVVFVSDRQCTEPLMSNDCMQSEHKSTVDLFCESRNSCTDVVDMQVQNITEELSSLIKNKCLSRECSVELKKLPQSFIEQHQTSESKLGEKKHLIVRLSQHNSNTIVLQSQLNESQAEAAELTRELKEECLESKQPIVKMKKMSITEINQKLKDNVGLDISVCDLVSEKTESKNNRNMASPNATGVGRSRKRTLTSSNDQVVSDKDASKRSSNKQKKKKMSLAHKDKDRSTFTHRPGTTRKACISGLSVSRWKNRDAFTSTTGQRGGTKAIDCTFNELIPSQHSQPVKQTDINMDFSTPVKSHNLNFSSLLSELTPNTHTWSRLKAALSIHRKVILTPKTPGAGLSSRRGLADLSQDLFATPFRTPLPKRLRSQLITHESQLVFDDDEMSDAEKVYAECGQQGPLAWGECLVPERMKQCVKIGEGTFGEVFSTTSGKPDGETVALKVIPVEGSEKVNGEEQKTFGEILHEIIISKELSCLKEKENNKSSGFIGLRDLHCVKGGYPPEFLNAWDKFDKQKGSENDRPDFFESEQLFIILEFEFGGTDLENSNGTLPSIIVAKSILHQVTAALAVAEQELHFEHRDLHWGNVLVKVTKQKTTEFSLNGAVQALETKGVLVRIIDYSLSRLEIDELTVSCDISDDEELFMGQGDYQFDIYRLMRQENSNEWSSYNPHSNVLWLHYLCSKLLDMKYRGSGGKRNKDMRSELTSFYDNVLQFSSATEVLQSSPLFH
ncbi:hypothetical protein WMY93_005644 [Mugilogobius chulae]|uniref:Serine/threonine-protein kinase haspin n=1 Tax=Mugilogobius chulae TaxID=88201 RepID=A0AAW0PKG5_9GOBI